jgi:aminoglycoside phosphotransferase (APT) family kinase protein
LALLTHRDPAAVGAGVTRWFAATRAVPDVQLVDAGHPSIGYSSETVFVDLACANGEVRELVVRLAPPSLCTFRDYDLVTQASAQRAAASAGVPIARPELVTDPAWIGVPFLVMPRVRGHIVGEVPALDPWLRSLNAHQRARVHETFVDAIATTHRADTDTATGVPRRDNVAELAYWSDYLDWSSDGSPVSLLVDALEWCRTRLPRTQPDPVLLWGDVRLGNVIFGDDLAPVAVLDWDMTSIGPREHDVAWLTAIETTTLVLLGQQLDGWPGRDATVARYEALSGHALHDFEWYETLAMVRSTAIMTRIGYLHVAAGLRPPMAIDDNPLLDLLAARTR